MKVRFWGTRGSIAKAGPTTVRYGGNTSCVELTSESGTTVVLDCGTGAHGLGHTLLRSGRGERGAVLISHTHWDHIQGLPFFSPLFVPGNRWDIYGPQGLGRSLKDVLAGQMEYTYFPITPEQFEADVGYHDLVEGSFMIGDIQVTTRYLNHPALTLGYRFEGDGVSVAYCTDHEPHDHRLAAGGVPEPGCADEAHGHFVADADLLIHDAQYTAEEYPQREGWGHSTVEYVADLARRAAVRRLALFHHDPMRTDDEVDRLIASARERVSGAIAPPHISGAAEGREVVFDPQTYLSRSVVAMGPVSVEPRAPSIVGLSVLVAVPPGDAQDTICEAATADHLRLLVPDLAHDPVAQAEADRPTLVITGDPSVARGLAGSQDPFVAETPVLGVDLPGADLTWPFSVPYARTVIRAAALRMPRRWSSAEYPANEDARQGVVDQLALDRGPEDRFDRHTRIAAALFGVEHAFINLIDGHEQWTKSSTRPDVPASPRDVSMCAHTLGHDGVLQVSDARTSERFGDHPQARRGLIRFYAGTTIEVDGHAVGTFCLTDSRPRRLTTAQETMLCDLASLAARELRQI